MSGYEWSEEEVEKAGELNILCCAISVAPLAVQLGNIVRIKVIERVNNKDEEKSNVWNLREEHNLGDSTLQTHQGRFYGDSTFVVCSNKGLYMRYWDSKKGESAWMRDSSVETEALQKMPLQNWPYYRSLQK